MEGSDGGRTGERNRLDLGVSKLTYSILISILFDSNSRCEHAKTISLPFVFVRFSRTLCSLRAISRPMMTSSSRMSFEVIMVVVILFELVVRVLPFQAQVEPDETRAGDDGGDD